MSRLEQLMVLMWNINLLFILTFCTVGKGLHQNLNYLYGFCELGGKELLQGLGFVVNSSETYRIKYKIILITKDNHSLFIFSHTHYD